MPFRLLGRPARVPPGRSARQSSSGHRRSSWDSTPPLHRRCSRGRSRSTLDPARRRNQARARLRSRSADPSPEASRRTQRLPRSRSPIALAVRDGPCGAAARGRYRSQDSRPQRPSSSGLRPPSSRAHSGRRSGWVPRPELRWSPRSHQVTLGWVVAEVAGPWRTTALRNSGEAATAPRPVVTPAPELLPEPRIGRGWRAAVRFVLLV